MERDPSPQNRSLISLTRLVLSYCIKTSVSLEHVCGEVLHACSTFFVMPSNSPGHGSKASEDLNYISKSLEKEKFLSYGYKTRSRSSGPL